MHDEPTTNHHHRRRAPLPRKVPLLSIQRRRRATPLARKRRLYQIARELAQDLGFDPDAVTLSERAVLHQAATLLLQVRRTSSLAAQRWTLTR
jgi:hypothetical protein